LFERDHALARSPRAALRQPVKTVRHQAASYSVAITISKKGKSERDAHNACKEKGNITTHITNNQLGGALMLDLPVLLLLILVLVIQHSPG
jgi:hypothetical protein